MRVSEELSFHFWQYGAAGGSWEEWCLADGPGPALLAASLRSLPALAQLGDVGPGGFSAGRDPVPAFGS